MPIASTASLVDALRQYRLLESAQLEEVNAGLQARCLDPKTLAKELILRDWLTPFQAHLLLEGKGHELVLGTYTLVAKLGEGGMGQVFKARNQKMGRIVALKLIRQEKLKSPTAIRRFQREVRAAAQLNHPNVVRAYDADEVDDALLLVMEYVDGTDLSKLVKKSGPLPIPDACAFIRQAALGLQHAYEQGLVHRDIKPHNLLLTRDGTVKILDMGLARLDATTPDEQKSTVMTQEGGFVGTPDYIAPEQAINSHTADIRADIYSLGCTFYYLLTGKVPFPDGFFTEKLLQHQFNEPPAIDQHRTGVPVTVSKIVCKMMAKKPEHRYQAPAEVAAALASVSDARGLVLTRAADEVMTENFQATTAGEPSGDTLNSALEYMARVGDGPKPKTLPPSMNSPGNKRRWLLCMAGAVLLAAFVAIALQLQRQLPPDNENGNFVLSEFWVAVAKAGTAPEKAKVVALQHPLASFSQESFSIGAAIDDNAQTGWAVLPQFGKNHIAVFELKQKVDFAGGTLLVFTLDHDYGGFHNIGCLRLSVTTRPPPILPFPDSPSLDSQSVYLSDLPETDVKVAPDRFFKHGRGPAEGFIMVNNAPSPKGLFVHPESNTFSSVGYELADKYRWFQAKAAINDTGRNGTPLTFNVRRDANILWKSTPLQQPGQMDDCSIDVSGVKRLELQVECPGPNSWSHAVWIEPRLLKAKPKP